MNLRRTLLLLVGVAAFVQWAGWREARRDTRQRETVTPLRRDEPATRPAGRASAVTGSETAGAQIFSAPTREDVRRLLLTTYRRELLSRELALEQLRYGANYWQAGPEGAALEQLAAARATLLHELNEEMNAIWRESLGAAGASAEPLVLEAFFDAEHPGPNLLFLSAAARERIERAAVEAGGGRPDFAAIAERVLVPSEAEHYRRWNAPAAVAWRDRLAGFEASESEFLAIVRLGAGEDAATLEGRGALAEAIGLERFAQLQRWLEPAASAARGDLRRNGLPAEHAGWLASIRTEAIAQIQNTWRDPLLSDGVKRDQVAQIEQGYGRIIATRLQRPGAALDGL